MALFILPSQGIDGGDIVNLDEGCLDLEPLKEKKLSHYHILGDYIKPDDNQYDFSKRVSYFKPRNKSQKNGKGSLQSISNIIY